jgi:phosphoadenosine phosphosulfate reductase
VDKVALAVQRLREFEPKEGYYVAFSGGKDSCVLLDLVKRAQVRYDTHYNATTVDPPELVRFIREYHPEVERHQPRETMWQLIVKNGMPPLRNMRYCCRELKEVGGAGRLVVTGIRWQESRYRKKRRLMEQCSLGKGRLLLHPIIDWLEADIWQYVKERGLPYCSLYDECWKRIGCIMCPNGGRKKMQREAERWPKFADAYRRACSRAVEKAKAEGRDVDWIDGDELYEWWITGKRRVRHGKSVNADQGRLFALDPDIHRLQLYE